jgi:hypothetical protein
VRKNNRKERHQEAPHLHSKRIGRIRFLDIERLARALRLRWYWFQWKNEDRPWTGLDIPCDKSDKDLFNASTVVVVGNGKSKILALILDQ